MLFVDCPFCNKRVFRFLYIRHIAKHTERLPDGQMSDHISLKEVERFSGSLAEIPCSYVHHECGGATQMPEKIIRSYLVNPFLYGSRSFCCGCNQYIAVENLYWIETEQCLYDYFVGLQQEYIKLHGRPPEI